MPELPEVETVVRMLAPLVGRRVTSVRVLHKPTVSGSPSKLDSLTGLKILRIFRRAKYIRMELESGFGLVAHLRMTGWLGVLTAGVAVPKLDPYVRVRFTLDDGKEELVFSDIRTFGRVWCGKTEALDDLKSIKKLGPEPFEISADEFIKRLKSKNSRLKSLLLNQEFIAGVGNIYADEALFGAGLHPLGIASRVSPQRAEKLLSSIQAILKAAIDAGGSSVENFRRPDGEIGWFQRELRIYGREGEPCKICSTKVKRIVVGQRGTWFCSKCQRR